MDRNGKVTAAVAVACAFVWGATAGEYFRGQQPRWGACVDAFDPRAVTVYANKDGDLGVKITVRSDSSGDWLYWSMTPKSAEDFAWDVFRVAEGTRDAPGATPIVWEVPPGGGNIARSP